MSRCCHLVCYVANSCQWLVDIRDEKFPCGALSRGFVYVTLGGDRRAASVSLATRVRLLCGVGYRRTMCADRSVSPVYDRAWQRNRCCS